MAAPRTEPAVSTAAITKFPTGETARGDPSRELGKEALAWKSDYRTGLPINYRNCRGNLRVARCRGAGETKKRRTTSRFAVRREEDTHGRNTTRRVEFARGIEKHLVWKNLFVREKTTKVEFARARVR